jgi:hypothetical protein
MAATLSPDIYSGKSETHESDLMEFMARLETNASEILALRHPQAPRRLGESLTKRGLATLLPSSKYAYSITDALRRYPPENATDELLRSTKKLIDGYRDHANGPEYIAELPIRDRVPPSTPTDEQLELIRGSLLHMWAVGRDYDDTAGERILTQSLYAGMMDTEREFNEMETALYGTSAATLGSRAVTGANQPQTVN